MVCCIATGSVAKSASMAGKAGKIVSTVNGPIIESAARIRTSPRRGWLVVTRSRYAAAPTGCQRVREMGATVARQIRTRSAGATSTSNPRRPPLTRMVSWFSAPSSRTVGRALVWPNGLIPPST